MTSSSRTEAGGLAVSEAAAEVAAEVEVCALDSVVWAEMVLRLQGMPPNEVRDLMSTADPSYVHRSLELHLERLEEWLGSQRRKLATIERILGAAAGGSAEGRAIRR